MAQRHVLGVRVHVAPGLRLLLRPEALLLLHLHPPPPGLAVAAGPTLLRLMRLNHLHARL